MTYLFTLLSMSTTGIFDYTDIFQHKLKTLKFSIPKLNNSFSEQYTNYLAVQTIVWSHKPGMVYTKIQNSEAADKIFQYAHTEQLSPKPAHRSLTSLHYLPNQGRSALKFTTLK